MSKVTTFIFMCLFLSFGQILAQGGSGNALRFPGSAQPEHVRLDTALNDVIDTSDFTVEWWMRGETMSSDPGIIANKDWASGNNPGFIIARTGNSTIKVNGIFTGGSRFDLNSIPVAGLQTDWVHLAVVFDRHSTHPDLKVYVNGMIADSLSLAGKSPTGAFAAIYPIVLGQDGTGTYGKKFQGSLDEVRFWKTARTEQEIRTMMCQTALGTETNLLASYNFNETGNSVLDKTGNYNGVLVNTPQRVVSGAPVGDVSTMVYPTSWSAQTLSLASPANGELKIDSIQKGAAGLHIYRTNAVPSSVTGIKTLANNDVFFGVFAANDTGIVYNVEYDYTNYSLAVTNEDSLLLFRRGGADSATWFDLSAARLKTNNFVKATSVDGKRNEFVLSNFVSYVCNVPTAASVANITYNSADFSWTTGGAVLWDVEYGTAGYTPGSGTLISSVTANPYTLSGLKQSTGYDFYVRDNCGANNTSAWVGPISFATIAAPVCNAPTNFSVQNVTFNSAQLSWVTGGSSYSNIVFGAAGIAPASGTKIDTVSSNPFVLTGLSPATSYDVYIQDTCNMANASAWVGPISFTTYNDYSQIGAGNAFNIGGLGYIDLSGGKQNADSLRLPDSTLTLEAWIKPSAFGQWKSIISFIQDNGNFERGWDLETRDNNKLGFALKGSNTTSMTYLETSSTFSANTWMHIAGVYTGDTMKIFVNGILEGYTTAQNGKIEYADSWLTLGSYKDDNENNKFQGELDEVRIWNVARTADEIRATMCQTLTGNEAGLVSYFDLNEAAGTSITDKAMAGNNGTFVTLPVSNWTVSGAALGDTSVYVYNQNYAGLSLQLGASAFGEVTLDSIQNAPEGMHLYWVNSQPNFTSGIADLGIQATYFGAFVAEGSGVAQYNLTYDYSNFTAAKANENFLNIYNRIDPSFKTWVNTGAARNANADVVKLTGFSGSKEIILADFVAPTCPTSSALATTNVQFFYADVNWVSGGATDWIIEYDVTGFQLGNGVQQVISGVPTTTLSGLQHSTTYDFYVKDSCNASDKSTWVGPFTFTTKNVCPEADSVSLVSVNANAATFAIGTTGNNSDWDIQWGPTGFTPGIGVISYVTGNPAVLQNLTKSTTYDAYFRANCDSIKSEWVGPITFTTDSTGYFSIDEYTRNNQLFVYPNPASDVFSISTQSMGSFKIVISDLTGKMVYASAQINGGSFKRDFDFKEMPRGMYIIRFIGEDASAVQKLILK